MSVCDKCFLRVTGSCAPPPFFAADPLSIFPSLPTISPSPLPPSGRSSTGPTLPIPPLPPPPSKTLLQPTFAPPSSPSSRLSASAASLPIGTMSRCADCPPPPDPPQEPPKAPPIPVSNAKYRSTRIVENYIASAAAGLLIRELERQHPPVRILSPFEDSRVHEETSEGEEGYNSDESSPKAPMRPVEMVA
jgi:hypothetical protein